MRSPVTIILPFFNQHEYTKTCVNSIIESTHHPYRIIAIDNGSGEDISPWLNDKFEDINIIRNGFNIGAPAAFNQGIKASDTEYVLLLNNDTIVTDGWLGGLVESMELDSDTGIVGPCTNPCLEILDFFPEKAGFRNAKEIQRTAAAIWAKRKGYVEYVPGITSFCMLIKNGMLDKIGLFDENYGLGTNDDHDMCLRARAAGFKIACAMSVFVFHFYSKTLGGLGMEDLDKVNRDYFVAKFGERALEYFEEIGQPYQIQDFE